jgi:Icc protein
MKRRDFIKVSLAVLGTVLSVGACANLHFTKDEKQTVRWAFISDTHIAADVNDNYNGFYPYKNLTKVISEIMTDLPDAVAVTGDMARLDGKVGDYANFQKLIQPLASKVPVYMVPGNHDDRANFLQYFPELPGQRQSVADKYVTVVEGPVIRLILLDSLFRVNVTPGLLGKEQRQWLRDYLNSCDDRPTILCLHHTLGDGDDDLLDTPYLFDIVASSRKVKTIIYGHSHGFSFSEYEGIHLVNLPATSYNFHKTMPVGWVEAHFTADDGLFVLHAIGGNIALDGSVRKLTWRE